MSISQPIMDNSEREKKKKKNEDVGIIVESVLKVVEISKSLDFKQKCLDIMRVDDYAGLERRSKKKLTKLLKHRFYGHELKAPLEAETSNQESDSLHTVPTTSPLISKRKYNNDLSTASQNTQVKKRSSQSKTDFPDDRDTHQEVPKSASSNSNERNRSDIDSSLIQSFLGKSNDIDLDAWFDDDDDDNGRPCDSNNYLINDEVSSEAAVSQKQEDIKEHQPSLTNTSLTPQRVYNDADYSSLELSLGDGTQQNACIEDDVYITQQNPANEDTFCELEEEEDSFVSILNASSLTIPDGNQSLYEHLLQGEDKEFSWE